MTERRAKARKDDLPFPGEDWPITRERWCRHRETLMTWARIGTRHPGWWVYERNLQPPEDHNHETELLMAMGELSAAELSELVSAWREDYDRAQEPGFAYCTGHHWLEGVEAKRAHYAWAGIPKLLLKQWEAERRRQPAKRRIDDGSSQA
jgi:hypothetical protein